LLSNDKLISVDHRVLAKQAVSCPSISEEFDAIPVIMLRQEMLSTSSGKTESELKSYYDRRSELKAFDDSKAGVKGLVDSGVANIPQIFIHESSTDGKSSSGHHNFTVPVIDFDGIHEDASLRGKIVEELREACKKWGFFQVINHGISSSVLDDMINGVRRFHEQDTEVKKEFYTRDEMRRVAYNTNFDFYQAPAANWRDSLYCLVAPHPPRPEELPAVCRDILIDYSKRIMTLGNSLFELLSEALGLEPNHLKDIGCAEGLYVLGHCYPACPEPELTMGTTKHADSGFLTLLLQDQIGGLQVLHENQWINVTPMPGALVVNVGDLFQLISNDKFVSATHRVIQLPAFRQPTTGNKKSDRLMNQNPALKPSSMLASPKCRDYSSDTGGFPWAN
ncbi:hypothetical protein D5086_016889, partial [Populus alba]